MLRLFKREGEREREGGRERERGSCVRFETNASEVYHPDGGFLSLVSG